MKGMVFTEFLDFAEEHFGLEEIDKMAQASKSNGAYTSVGTYDHAELVAMLLILSESTGVTVSDLLKRFGHHLFGYLVSSYPAALDHASSAFELLSHIDGTIHVEVRKLYPDSELPKFEHEMVSEDLMRLTYSSERALADLAEGLLLGCFEHYRESVNIERQDLSNGEGKVVQFDLKRMK